MVYKYTIYSLRKHIRAKANYLLIILKA